ncbi:Cell division protein DivIC (FtsB), stabilizes FtsL against RasP cleavage [Fulvivirga imtechensis AK7]|uniref:Cell division protein DivIC (FtsB), stabilizes FtsL against RasP cleavage n=1 Tax=Fulvivirga imtechensis AK7 TaxID=1237149 RepID=L8JWW5_9BACT|nr:septum formation initiator family protein [Fulvivirga imtechensis]ELR72688.1 Cell division protein DivIC (FtsB), stabilizes FtsL against RasP cleavage [Fulvivirga imtechensis AK7]
MAAMKLPKVTKNFYFIFSFCFLVWMLFIDANDIVTQFQLKQQLENLEDEKAYYLEKIDEVKKDREELLSNDALLEKFAREKYYMKKESEDLFVIVEEKK